MEGEGTAKEGEGTPREGEGMEKAARAVSYGGFFTVPCPTACPSEAALSLT